MRNPIATTVPTLRRTAFASALAIFASAPVHAGIGDPIGGEIEVNTFTTGQQRTLSVAMNAEDGDFVIAWMSYSQEDKSGVYAQRFDADGVKQGGEFRVNQTTAGHQSTPNVAMAPDGSFVVAWESSQDGQGMDVYARRYGANGAAQGNEFRVNDYMTSVQRDADVGIDADGDFVIAWESYGQDGDDWGVYAQRYYADGSKFLGNFRVSQVTANRQINPSVAVEPDGDFVIAHQSFTSGFKHYDIYAQRYSRFGGKIGDQFLVNATVTGPTVNPSVAVDAEGSFVVAYEQKDDGVTQGIYAQRFAANGTKQGNEFAVNVVKDHNQVEPKVSRDALGRFTIVWTSYGQDQPDEANSGVYQRRYTKEGNAFGGEKRINTTTVHSEEFPDIAMTNDGGWVVAWDSRQGIVDGKEQVEVVAQLFDGAATPPPPDADADGVPDAGDNCPLTPNADQADTDENGIGDACDVPPDGDGDGIPDAFDNCPFQSNDNQVDSDEDNAGDACDATPLGACEGKPVTLRGTRGPDTLTGTSRDDVILGLDGDDRIDGLEGDDTICGGAGNDTLNGGAGRDRMFGQGGHDKLLGKGGADVLNGGDGDDALVGASGNDDCDGAAGTDTAGTCEFVLGVP
ncbi:MAG TPA: thrombospondin type 3 repeat-containing protein [Nevskiaceae bacterium]|nr:thrombospondin type 3 repeat-containing protein [Nevskiaceae bacterium]